MLRHIFTNGSATRTLPELDANGQAVQVLGEYDDDHSFTGGAMSCSGIISPAEYAAHTDVYTLGARWVVQDTETSEYIFGGELNDPEKSEGVVRISSIGYGGLSDRVVQRFLLQSRATDQWQSGGELGFGDGDDEINASVHGNTLMFRIEKQTEFKRNNAGNPTVWRTGMYFWAEDADIRRVQFVVSKHPKGDSAYTIDLVKATQPDTSLGTPVDSWSLGGNSEDTHNKTVPADNKVVGLRVTRPNPQKHAPGRRFKVKELKVWGPITQADSYSVKQAVEYLLGLLSATTTAVEATSQSALPYDAIKSSVGDLLDDLTSWEGWYWTMYPNSAGTGRHGVAQQLGTNVWNVTDAHSPTTLIPATRYNKVAYEYVKHELSRSGSVTASPNPFPSGVNRTYDLDAGEPAEKETMQELAQQVANFLSTIRRTGSCTLHTVEAPGAPGVEVSATKVRPGDKLVFTTLDNAEAIISGMKFDPSGKLVDVELADGEEVIERILNKRRKRLNVGAAPASETPKPVGKDRPAAPTGVAKSFKKVEEKDGKSRWHMIVTWNEVTEDVNGVGTQIKRYHIRTRPLDRDTHKPIPNELGGGWRTKHTKAEDDDEDGASEQLRAVLRNFEQPKKWKWETQVKAEDTTGQRGAWSGKTAPKQPPTDSVRPPRNVKCEVKEHTILVDWEAPVDTADEALASDRVDTYGEDRLDYTASYFKVKVQVRESSGPWENWRPQDGGSKRSKSTQKTFHVNNPGDRKFRGAVATVDSQGNSSDYVFSGDSKGPSSSSGGGSDKKDDEEYAGYDHPHKDHHNGTKPASGDWGHVHPDHHQHAGHGEGSPIGPHGNGDPYHDHGDGHDKYPHKHHKQNGQWDEHPNIHSHNHTHEADDDNAAPPANDGGGQGGGGGGSQQPPSTPPPTPPNAPELTAYSNGADVSWTYNAHLHKGYLDHYEVELWEDKSAEFRNEKLVETKNTPSGKGDPDNKTEHFGNIHVVANRYYRSKYRVWGSNGQVSGYSPWSGIKKA